MKIRMSKCILQAHLLLASSCLANRISCSGKIKREIVCAPVCEEIFQNTFHKFFGDNDDILTTEARISVDMLFYLRGILLQ